MAILVVSDVHRSYPLLTKALDKSQVRAAISCGDLTIGFPDREDVRLSKPLYSVYGNHERWEFVEDSIPNLRWLTAGKVFEVGGIKIAGMGGVVSKSPWKPGHFTEGEVRASEALAERGVDIFITHHPPKYYADLCGQSRDHCGSAKVLRIMETVRPKLLISGHLHWQQFDIFGRRGEVDTCVVTLGRLKFGDYALLTGHKLRLYKRGERYCDVYWDRRSSGSARSAW
jgi:Icc-related predicted phosphoesterase